MDEGTLIERLTHLGIDNMNFKALPLLPLVQVAWADGEIQPEERSLILKLAKDTWGLNEDGKMLLNNWLHYRPTDAYMQRGQQAMVALASRERGMKLDPTALGDVVKLATDVAKAAGGLFGFGAISKSEAAAIKEIASALKIPQHAQMEAVAALDDKFGAPPKQAKVTLTLKTAQLGSGESEAVLTPEMDKSMRLAVTRVGVMIGSAEGCDMLIEFDPSVSPKHVQLIERSRSYFAIDQNSTGGTWVNDERIAERRLLGGESIRVGQHNFIFKWLKRISI